MLFTILTKMAKPSLLIFVYVEKLIGVCDNLGHITILSASRLNTLTKLNLNHSYGQQQQL